MPISIVGALHKDQPVLMQPGSEVKLPLRGREPIRVLDAVFVAEETNIEIAPFDFIQ